MPKKENYFLLTYRDIPDTEFICQCGGETRIKVSKLDRRSIYSLSVGYLYGAMERFVFVFENIGSRITENEEVYRAVNWYKNHLGLQKMQV